MTVIFCYFFVELPSAGSAEIVISKPDNEKLVIEEGFTKFESSEVVCQCIVSAGVS